MPDRLALADASRVPNIGFGDLMGALIFVNEAAEAVTPTNHAEVATVDSCDAPRARCMVIQEAVRSVLVVVFDVVEEHSTRSGTARPAVPSRAV